MKHQAHSRGLLSGRRSMTILSTGGAFQCSEPVGTVPGSLGPIHSCHQSALLCHFCSHLSAPAAACRHQGTTQGPGVMPYPMSPTPTASACLWALRCRDSSSLPKSREHPLYPHPRAFPHPEGLLTKAWGPGTGLEAPPFPQQGPRPSCPSAAHTTSCRSPASISSGQGLLFK